MDVFLRDYQMECLQHVVSKINEGAKHISVVMTSGLGKFTTSIFVASELATENKTRVAMVIKQKAMILQAKRNISISGSACIDFFSVDEFINIDNKYSYVFFHDLSNYDRRKLFGVIKDKEYITISFFEPGQEFINDDQKSDDNQVFLLDKLKFKPIVCVYVTNEVLDIRDAKYAGEKERIYINKKNIALSSWLIETRNEIIVERDEISHRKEYLQAYLNAIKSLQSKEIIKRQALDIERLKEKLQEDEKDKKINKLMAKVEEYQEQLVEKEAMIAQQDQMIAFQQDVLSSFGLDVKFIKNSFMKIQNLRVQLEVDLKSEDESVKEIALKKFQDNVASVVSSLTENVLSKNDQEYYKSYLVEELSPEVWNKLDEKSKVFLITAKTNYESMIKMEDNDKFDYSGVCLLVTKALEVETSKRFFGYYKDYLNKKYNSVSSWPNVLRKSNNSKITNQVKSEHEFTLGSVVSVLGMRRNYDKKGNIIGYLIGDIGNKKEFQEFAKNKLFKKNDLASVDKELDNDIRFIEKVRLDYRNPSAHRDRLTITSAKRCLDYVIDVEHMLKNMLSAMKL